MKPVDKRLIGKDGIGMNEMMTFPDTWEEFEKLYGFNDAEEIYTNNSRLIPSFRVKQWLDHLPSVQPEFSNNSKELEKNSKELENKIGELINRQEVLKLPQRKGYAVNGWDTYIRVSDIKELSPVQSEQELLKDGTLVVKTDFDMTKFDRVNVIQNGTHYGDLFYQDDDTRRKGKWVLDNPHSEIYRYACSECHAHHRSRYDFCPSCGADMKEGE